MAKRKKLVQRHAKKLFTATAQKTNRKNVLQAVPMRGGFRI